MQIDELVDNLEILCEHAENGSQLIEAFKTFDIHKDGFIR